MIKQDYTAALIKEQLELEQLSISEGITRFRKYAAQGGDFSCSPSGIGVLNVAIGKLKDTLDTFKDSSTQGSPNATLLRKMLHTSILHEHDLVPVAFVLSKCILDLAFGTEAESSHVVSYAAICNTIGNTFLHHYNYASFKAKDTKMNFYMEKTIKESSSSLIHRAKVVSKYMVNSKVWKPTTLAFASKVSLGSMLLDMFITSTSLCFLKVERIGVKTHKILVAHPSVLKHIQNKDSRMELMRPVYYPMLVPPLPWTSWDQGGYLGNTTASVTESTLVYPSNLPVAFSRTTAPNNVISHHGSSSAPYRVADILGQTPWVINRRLLGILRDNQSAFANNTALMAPSEDDLRLPIRPWSDDETYKQMKITNPDAVKDWKRRAAVEYDRVLGKTSKSKRLSFFRKLHVAEQFENRSAIYFPHNVDFRGRYYPISSWVTPQSDDLGRALLQFRDGGLVTDDNLQYLFIHIANLAGFDKVPFAKRIAWVEQNLKEILRAAQDPLGTMGWWSSLGDEPWSLLGSFLVLESVLLAPAGTPRICPLVLSVDGTCNGLQHFSAMLRDPVGASGVNLRPSETPQDIYRNVAEETERLIKVDLETLSSDDQRYASAQYWTGKVTRKVTKRNTMTTPYGVTLFGMKDQLDAELIGMDSIDETYTNHTRYLAGKIYSAMGTTINSAQVAMDWLRAVAGQYMDAGLNLSWTTPLGYKVVQDYPKKSDKVLWTSSGKQRVRIMTHPVAPGAPQNRSKNISAFPPNFVHSLDAAHLGMTVIACEAMGVHNFGMVHDSYGTSIDSSATIGKVLREQFVHLYRDFDVLQAVVDDFVSRGGDVEKLPQTPKKGSFDLCEVLRSQYFFM